MQLSNQAVGALMLALQKSLMEQADIVPMLKDFVFITSDDGLVVTNPPTPSVIQSKPTLPVLITSCSPPDLLSNVSTVPTP